jgi:hypothetical protein
MKFLAFALTALAASLLAQQCDSVAASGYGGWRTMQSAPRDGTIVEMIQTYGVAPWYGIFKWVKEKVNAQTNCVQIKSGVVSSSGTACAPPAAIGRWQSAEDDHSGVVENKCLFWRPYEAKGKYVDPTGGAQKSVAYWCAYMHRPYDAKTDRCK